MNGFGAKSPLVCFASEASSKLLDLTNLLPAEVVSEVGVPNSQSLGGIIEKKTINIIENSLGFSCDLNSPDSRDSVGIHVMGYNPDNIWGWTSGLGPASGFLFPGGWTS